MPTRAPTIAATVTAILTERGGRTAAEIGDRLAELGRTKAMDTERAALNAVEHNDTFLAGSGGRWWSLVERLDGAVFTVAPTALERHRGFILLRPDLALVARFCPRHWWYREAAEPGVTRLGSVLDPSRRVDPYRHRDWHDERFDDEFEGFDDHGVHMHQRPDPDLRAALGDEVADDLLAFIDEIGEQRADDATTLGDVIDRMWEESVITGPEGWMPALRPRDVLAIRIRDGSLDLAPVNRFSFNEAHERAAISRIGNIARTLLDEEGGRAPSIRVEDVLERLAIDCPGVLKAPLPPVSRLLTRAGLDTDGALVRRPGQRRLERRWFLAPDPDAPWGYEPGDRVA